MAGLLIQNQLKAPVTVVDNRFIERYMADANGEFVKVYLCLLRFQGTDDLTVAGMADFLNHTEADVIRALRYWEKAGLLRIYQDGEGKPAGILLLNFEEEEREREAAATVQRKPEGRKIIPVKEKAEKKPGCSGTEETAGDGKQALGRTLSDLQKDEAFSQLLFLTEAYRKQPLSRKDMDIFVNLYGNLGMPAELLEYLVESCVEAGHVSAAYMEKVALNWHQAGIRTPEEAKAQSSLYKKEYFGALRALGISGRNPVKAELGYLDRWFGQYGFTKEIVEEACGRTMRAIQKPSFPYVDKILQGWKEKGVRCLGDIERLDKKPEVRKGLPFAVAEAGGQKQPLKSSRSSNRFHNFKEHDYDYDALMKQAIKKSREI